MNFIAIHAGAGFHSQADESELSKLCKRACSAGMRVLTAANSDLKYACCRAAIVLEDSSLTNAGFGSNLTLEKCVECDAGMMSSRGFDFASVSGVKDVKNPIRLCYEMLKSRVESYPILVPPLTIAGDSGCSKLACEFKMDRVAPEKLIARRSLVSFKRATQKLAALQTGSSEQQAQHLLDTVGCISIDKNFNSCACCSSGGALLKKAGRVGHSACFGAGTWAQETEKTCIAISVSGCGETLVKTHFAERCAEKILQHVQSGSGELTLPEVLRRFFTHRYFGSALIGNYEPERRIAGAIVALSSKPIDIGVRSPTVELAYVHNSKTLCFGYMAQGQKAASVFSRSNNGDVVVGGFIIKSRKSDSTQPASV